MDTLSPKQCILIRVVSSFMGDNMKLGIEQGVVNLGVSVHVLIFLSLPPKLC